jgi:GT2 family glycosyltransferase
VTSHPLAILLVFRNNKDLAERALTTIYSTLKPGYYLYVVDDASDDDTSRTIQSVIEHFAHDQTFFFENPTELGRERSIKELLQLIESPLLWMPKVVDEQLSDLRWVLHLLESDVVYPFDLSDVMSKDVGAQPPMEMLTDPEEITAKWLSAVDLEGVLDVPEQPIKTAESESITEHSEHASEVESSPIKDVDFTPVPDLDPEMRLPVDVDLNEESEADFDGLVGQVRPMGSSKKQKLEKMGFQPEQVQRVVSPPQKSPRESLRLRANLRKNAIELPENASDATQKVFVEVQSFVNDGENLYALKAIETAQLSHPADSDLIRLKIKILEFMRRYVEAAELKHQLKLGGPGVAKTKIRREAILIVDPSEDPDGTALVDTEKMSKTNQVVTADEQVEKPVKRIEGLIFDAADEVLFDDQVLAESDLQSFSTVDINHHSDDQENHSVEQIEPSVQDETVPNEVEAEGVEVNDTSEPVMDIDSDDTSERKTLESSELQKSNESMESEMFSTKVAATQPSEASVPRPVGYDSNPLISIVIPTTIDGKPLLERTLFSLSTKADKADRELIIIDNASLDDTFEYLKHLKKENFMQIRVITNPVNYGFARAVNQGIEAARGTYVLVMHNDVVIHSDIPGKLANIMEQHPEVTTLGPLTEVTWNEEQRRKSVDPDETVIKKTRLLDSFCMMIRRSKARKFDERYGLAFFDDADYCMEDAKQGGVIAIAPGLKVDHLGGSTTNVIGREFNSRSYWKNASDYEHKWDMVPHPAPFTEKDSDIDRLCMISELLNPFYPEPHLVKMAEEMMTSELRNEIMERNYGVHHQTSLIKLMLALDMRDVARVLEDSLDPGEFDDALLQQLVDFYYQKHIYSRSLKYIERFPNAYKPFNFKLLELKVYMGMREFDKASLLLGALIREMPTHPELLKITSEIHKVQGTREEAEEFQALAHQTDPYSFK